MKLYVNGKAIQTINGISCGTLKDNVNPNANVIIVNAREKKKEDMLKDSDRVTIIEKGKYPAEDELEHMITARHTPGIYEKLKKASVALAGAGGLGSNAAVALARMGVGRIKLVDFDVVEPSNLNRQYYNLSHIGLKKVDALRETIRGIAPFVKVETDDSVITPLNVSELFRDYDVVIEALDDPETKAVFIKNILNDLPRVFVVGSSGIAGYGDTGSVKTVRFGKRCVVVGDFETEASEKYGLMASRVAVAANIQANEAVRYIMGETI